jgi:hypothetical protein
MEVHNLTWSDLVITLKKYWIEKYDSKPKCAAEIVYKIALSKLQRFEPMMNLKNKYAIGSTFFLDKDGVKVSNSTAANRTRFFHLFIEQTYGIHHKSTIFSRNDQILPEYCLSQPRTLPCKYEDCRASFDNEIEWEYHRLNDHAEIQYKCKICGTCVSQPSSHFKVKHLTEYNQTSNVKCAWKDYFESSELLDCSFCDKKFSTLQTARTHVKLKHELDKVKCSHCNTEISASCVYTHNYLHHPAVPHDLYAFKCEPCKMTFKMKTCLRQHERKACHLQTIQNQKPENKAKLEHMLSSHGLLKPLKKAKTPVETSSNQSKHACTYKGCTYKTDRLYRLKEHVEGHHKNSYACKECGKTFTRKESLERHEKEACSDNLESTQVSCFYCHSTYKARSHKRHLQEVCLLKMILGKYPGSKGEQLINHYLQENKVQFEIEKCFSDMKSPKGNHLYLDFYIPDHKAVVEYHGMQHYQASTGFGGEEKFEETKLHDGIKRNYVENTLGFRYIEIDSRVTKTDYQKIVDILSEELDLQG